MSELLYVFSRLASAFVTVLELAMLLRVLVSWLPLQEDNKFVAFLYMMTEPFVYPIRLLFDKKGWFADSVLDVPFFTTYLLISVICWFV